MSNHIPKRFTEELKAFEERKAELLDVCEGKYAVFKGRDFVGVFDNPSAAYNAGLEKFGNVPFLIKLVLKQDRVEHIPTLSVGLIHACL